MALLPRLRLAAVALALALPGAPAHAQGVREDIRIGIAIEPAGLDPTVAAPVAIGQVVWQNVFQGLTRITESGAVEPQLAMSWEVADEGRTLRFTLREGVRFANGVAFDAATARFTLDRARGAASTNPQKAFFAKIQGIETPDPRTLVLRLEEPDGDLLYHLAWPAAVMVEPTSSETNRTAPVGTGPYELAEWRPGDRLRLERRDGYWGEAPALRQAEFRFIADPQAQAAALRSGAVDAFPEFGAPELVEELRREERLAVVVGDTELKVVAGMNARRKPFDDARVRRALMMAVDRAAVIEGAWSGFGTAIGSHYTPNDPGFVDLADHVPYDPAAARALLAEAGYPDGFETTIRTPQMAYATRSSEILQALLAEIGIALRIVPTEFPAVWVDQVLKGHDFDMTIVAHAEPMDIGIYARPDYYFGYRNPAFDAAVETAGRTLDEPQRLALYGEAQRILADDLPALYLFVMPKLGIWDRRLEGLWADEPIPANDLTGVRWRP